MPSLSCAEAAIHGLSTSTRPSLDGARASHETYVERDRPFPEGLRLALPGVQGVLDVLVELGELTAPTPPPSRCVEPSL